MENKSELIYTIEYSANVIHCYITDSELFKVFKYAHMAIDHNGCEIILRKHLSKYKKSYLPWYRIVHLLDVPEWKKNNIKRVLWRL